MHRHRHSPGGWTRYAYVIAGSFLVALGLETFLVPNRLVDGGVTGIAILLSYLSGWPVGLFLVFLNLPFLYFGYVQIGRTFAWTTAVAVLLLSGFATLLTPVPAVTSDLLLVSVFGGLLIGGGLGLILRHGGSLDGADIVALTLSRATGFSVGEVILGLNVLIFGAAMWVIGADRALYSLLTYFSAYKMVDLVVQGLDESRGVFIISARARDISEAIQHRLGRGVTHLHAEGGRSQSPLHVLYTVVTRLELAKLKSIVLDHDDDAFFAIHPVAEAGGGTLRKHNIH